VARKTILVSDLSNKELDEKNAVQIVVKFNDARRGQYLVDAHPDDVEVKKLIEAAGTKQARRGRRPRAGTEA
jgi:hypothetical protein